MMVKRDYMALYEDWTWQLEQLKALTPEDLWERHQIDIESAKNKVNDLRKKLEQLGEKFDD